MLEYDDDEPQRLPEVDVIGTMIVDSGGLASASYMGGSGMTFEHLVAPELMDAGINPTTNVQTLQCAPSADLQARGRITSRDNEIARQDAVRALVGLRATAWAAAIAYYRLLGSTRVVNGVHYLEAEFTFADGGTERYYVNPTSSNNAVAVLNTLVQGDGVAQTAPCA